MEAEKLGEIKRNPLDLESHFYELEEKFQGFNAILEQKLVDFVKTEYGQKFVFTNVENKQNSYQDFDERFKDFLKNPLNNHFDEEHWENERQKENFVQLFTAISLSAQNLSLNLSVDCEDNVGIGESHKLRIKNFVKYSLSEDVKKSEGTLIDVYETAKFFPVVNDVLKTWRRILNIKEEGEDTETLEAI